MQDTSGPVIEIHGLVKDYGRVKALDGLNMSVGSGQLFGFLGPNGAGKTTAIRVITGFIRATAGSAQVFGMDAWERTVDIKRRIGFLPDVPGMYDNFTGQEFLTYIGKLHGHARPPLQDRMIERLELSRDALGRRMKGYSHGMKKKVAIIQAMQHNPELLVMDEPSDGLDPLMQREFFSLLREFRDQGGTVFMSSHTLSEVEELCERVAIIRAGKLVASDTVEGLRRGRMRTMEVEFKYAAPGGLEIPGVRVLSQKGLRWVMAVSGDVTPLLRALAQYEIADMVFEQPRLEDLFLGYYQKEASSVS